MKAKLFGFINSRQAIIKYPESDQTVPAHYARAYAYHLGAYPEKALSEAEALLKTNPHDPYFLELKGQICLESGRPAEAIAPLREATERSGRAPLIASMLGHALISTEDKKNDAEAKTILKTAVSADNENPFAWYQLGMIYDQRGRHAARGAGHRRAQQSRGQSQARAGERRNGHARNSRGNSGLSSGAGHRHGVARPS